MLTRPGLTARQAQIVELIAAGTSNKQIAHAVGITEAGVKKHIEAVMRRYNLHRRAAVVCRAIREGDLNVELSDGGPPAAPRRRDSDSVG